MGSQWRDGIHKQTWQLLVNLRKKHCLPPFPPSSCRDVYKGVQSCLKGRAQQQVKQSQAFTPRTVVTEGFFGLLCYLLNTSVNFTREMRVMKKNSKTKGILNFLDIIIKQNTWSSPGRCCAHSHQAAGTHTGREMAPFQLKSTPISTQLRRNNFPPSAFKQVLQHHRHQASSPKPV